MKRRIKRNSRGNRKGSRKGAGRSGEQVTVNGTYYTSVTTIVSGAAQTLKSLSMSGIDDPRVTAIADLYRFYRFDKVKATFYTDAADTLAFVGFTPGGDLQSPTTTLETIPIAHHAWFWPIMVRPATLNLSRSVLSGNLPIKWWYTQGRGDTEFDTQGQFVVSTINQDTMLEVAGVVSLLVEFSITFRERLSTAESMQRLAQRSSALKYTTQDVSLDCSSNSLEVQKKEKPKNSTIQVVDGFIIEPHESKTEDPDKSGRASPKARRVGGDPRKN